MLTFATFHEEAVKGNDLHLEMSVAGTIFGKSVSSSRQ